MVKINSKVLLRYLVIGILLPLFVQYVFYFRFTGNYMTNVFSEKSFTSFYGTNVFRYRVLGKELHLWLYHQLKENESIKSLKENIAYEKRLNPLEKQPDNYFYLTYFLIAAIFTILASCTLLYLFDVRRIFELTDLKIIFVTSTVIMLIGVSQFVVTPYDNIGYFLLITSSLLFVKFLQTQHWLYWLLLNSTIIISTLNHESAAITLSFMAAIYFTYYRNNFRWLRFMIIPLSCYLFTWIGLRLYLDDGVLYKTTEGVKLWRNLDIREPSNLMGVLFALFTFYFAFNISNNPINQKLVKNFFLMASPYVLMIPVIGIMIEIRLWVPVIIGFIILSQLNFSAIKFQLKQENEFK